METNPAILGEIAVSCRWTKYHPRTCLPRYKEYPRTKHLFVTSENLYTTRSANEDPGSSIYIRIVMRNRRREDLA
jgi:hypothetical protein